MNEPKDYETRMGYAAQVSYAQTVVAWIVLICAAVAVVWGSL